MSTTPEVPILRRPRARFFGPVPNLKELNLLCWGLFLGLLVLPFCVVLYSHQTSGQPLMENAELDFVYLYGMGRVFNEQPVEKLYDWEVQRRICTEIHPLKKGEYGPIPYHPIVGILFRPFAKLPYLTAYLLWISISLILYVGGIAMVTGRYFRHDPLRRSLIFCLALSYYPFAWTMMTGHLSALGFLAMSAALTEEDRGRPLLSGLALSVCVYKPTLLVLILPMLLVTRRFRTFAGFAAGSVVLALFATAMQGIRLWSGYVPMLFSFGRGAARVQTHTFKEVWKYVDAASFSSSIQPVLPAGIFRLIYPVLLAGLGCVALWLIGTWWRSAGAAKPARTLVWAATLTWTLVLNVYVPIYDCILIVLTVITTAGVLKEIPESRIPAVSGRSGS